MLSHLAEGAEWIGAAPLKRASSLYRQGFRKNEETVAEINQAQRRSGKKRGAWSQRAEPSPDRRSYDEADSKSRAYNAEVLGAPFRRTDVGDVCISRRERSARCARDRAADEKPRERRRES